MEALQIESKMNQGYIIDLAPDAWMNLNRKVRNSIRKAARELYVREGTLEELRNLHWNPSYLPIKIRENQKSM